MRDSKTLDTLCPFFRAQSVSSYLRDFILKIEQDNFVQVLVLTLLENPLNIKKKNLIVKLPQNQDGIYDQNQKYEAFLCSQD